MYNIFHVLVIWNDFQSYTKITKESWNHCITLIINKIKLKNWIVCKIVIFNYESVEVLLCEIVRWFDDLVICVLIYNVRDTTLYHCNGIIE